MSTFSEIASSDPKLALRISWLNVTGRMGPPRRQPKILVGTHHKVLTVYMGRVFRTFASASCRNFSRGRHNRVDYTADILLDSHSQFDFTRLSEPYVGMHVRRDPRDVIVSCAKYHLTSQEEWLHIPRADLSGKTYQEHLRELPTLDEQLLFELDNAGGLVVRHMLEWNYHGCVRVRCWGGLYS